MGYTLSLSTRFIMAGLLVLALLFQCMFSGALFAGGAYAHNGRIALGNEAWSDAVWYYRNANAWFPHDHHWQYGQATGLMSAGDPEAAFVALDQTLKCAPHYGPAFTSMGQQLVQSGNFAAVTPLAEQGLAITPEFWSFHYLMGLVAASEGRSSESVNHLRMASRNATSVVTHVQRTAAQVSFGMSDLESARYEIDKGLRAAPTMPELWQLRGQIYHTGDDVLEGIVSYNRALELYQERISASPESAAGNVRRWAETSTYAGVAHADLKNDDKALMHFGNAVSQYIELTVFADAVLEMHGRVGVTLGNASPAAQVMWGNVLSSAGHAEKAIAVFGRMEALDAEAFPDLSRYYYAKALTQLKRVDEALGQYKKMSSLSFRHGLAYADTLRMAGQPAAARFEYTRMLTMMTIDESQRAIINQRIAMTPQ